MRIGEFAKRAGVSPRSLRHYEDAGLLVPARTSAGYRDYSLEDLDVVARIRPILATGLGVAAARRYLDCVEVTGDNRAVAVTMCPNLRHELDVVEERISRHRRRLAGEQGALNRFRALADTSAQEQG
ncbi:MerR family transcriptional regulator [Actinomyces viscosus]|uniref:HTH-type transcriptional regulator glnR n=1 Tax=Actinomyces viscosus TaxID=1656 RepID=A0A3S4WI96_ACTVI|nr:MerR family transcriptional regulator [Actinomyces viscosus]TFH51552.1 MerR family transcriptional regulator [Actinomyces viscosus]VEI14598.1 HTH-type transcriptional regulator glnR [Actinomyces viscosus]